jgi:hypothetical protein
MEAGVPIARRHGVARHLWPGAEVLDPGERPPVGVAVFAIRDQIDEGPLHELSGAFS